MATDVLEAMHGTVAARLVGRTQTTSSRRTTLAQRARAHLEANLDQPFSLRALSETAGCSERMLQYVFREIYGMGPQAWFLTMKLKEANRELGANGLGDVRVTDVALRWGFTHLGRFSVEYRRMFGESPSQTLRRRSPDGSDDEKMMPGDIHRPSKAPEKPRPRLAARERVPEEKWNDLPGLRRQEPVSAPS